MSAETIAREILAANGAPDPHPALLADTIREVEYHGLTEVPAPAPAPVRAAARPEPKLYYVDGKHWGGMPGSVKTYAQNPADARYNALWTLETAGRVRRG